jgi:hypothetical protein
VNVERYTSQILPTVKAAVMGVDLIDIHPSPSHLKAGSKFEILATVVNNSSSTIMFVAGACHSPLSAFFKSFNVVIRHTQGCTATSPPFKLKSGEQVSVAGPSSGTIYRHGHTGSRQEPPPVIPVVKPGMCQSCYDLRVISVLIPRH